MNQTSNGLAWGMLLLAAMIWGGMFEVARLILPTVDPFTITAIRYGVGALIFLVVLLAVEGRSAIRTDGRGGRLFLYGTIGFAGFNMLAYSGLAHSRPEHAAVIMAMMPMITVLVNWLRSGQHPAVFTLFSVLVAFVGVFMVVTNGHPEQALRSGEVKGDVLLLIAALCWVIYTLGSNDFPSWSPLRYTVISCALGTVSILVITTALMIHGDIHLPAISTLRNLFWEFAYVVLLGAVVAVLSWNSGVRRLGAVNAVLFINLVPVTAFIIGVTLGHAFGAGELIGTMLVIGALIANNLYIRRHIAVSTS